MTRSAVALARLVAPDPAPSTDVQLLRSFVTSQGNDSFAELVRRHGPMVLATCRRVLSDPHDAEDAFQAVFFVFARRAASIRGANLAGWLYGVAVRTARGVRLMRDRRRKRERAQVNGAQGAEHTGADFALAQLIDEELARLPDSFREPVVLCELRGLSRKQAAAELGIPEGTLSSRLAAAKRKLAVALTRRGVAVPGALAALLAPAHVSAALLESATTAAHGAAGRVAETVAATVLKGMLFDQLKVAALTAGLLVAVVCGGLAMSSAPGAPPGAPRTAAPAPAPESAALVKQLGSDEFTEREAAQKELRRRGGGAEAALRAGLKSDDPEIRARSAALLAEIRKDALVELARGFDPKAENPSDHPVWKRFRTIAGDTRASRDLFARLLAHSRLAPATGEDNWLARLDAAEAGPKAAAEQYSEAIRAVARRYQRVQQANDGGPAANRIEPCDTVDEVAYLLFLGSYPGTEQVRPEGPDSSSIYQGENQLLRARGTALALQGKERAPGQQPSDKTAELAPGSARAFAKLLAAWIAPRSSRAMEGYFLAVKYQVPEVLPSARAVAANKASAPAVRCAALYAVAQFGARADLPLFADVFDDTVELVGCRPIRLLEDRPQGRFTSLTGDQALALALLLCDQDPGTFGFGGAGGRLRRENGRPVIAEYEPLSFGFADAKTRAAAHAKARAFLDKQKDEPRKEDPKPEPDSVKLVQQLGSEEFTEREAAEKELRKLGARAEPALRAGLKSDNPEIVKRCRELLEHLARSEFEAKHWARFARVVGDDKASRLLFERIRSLPRNVELLNAVAADPNSAGKLYHARWAELNKGAQVPLGPGMYQLRGAPLADVLGWMYLGTFPGAESSFHQSSSLDFLPVLPVGKNSTDALTSALKDDASAAPLHKLAGAWTAARNDYSGRAFGFELALQFDIKEVLPAARETLTAKVTDDPYPGNTARNVGFAMLVVGKLGSKDDLPLLEKYAANDAVCSVFLKDPPPEPGQPIVRLPRPPKDGQDITAQLRDVSATMRLHLLGENPDAFGFFWPFPSETDRKPVPPEARFLLGRIGFIRDADRTAAHKKAKERFDKQK
jgi:RNA polymerase sigma factor (sigma-70 family)